MSVLLFRLNGVPDDEADEIRELLSTNNVDFYETYAGRWGISVAAIWLKDDGQLSTAKRLIDDYQQDRTLRVRDEYAALCREGKQERMVDRFMQAPVRFVFYLIAIAVILYFMLFPFLSFN